MANKTRSFGQGYTVFEWQNQVIGMANEVTVTGVEPVAAAIDIQPINAARPIEIVTAGAHRHGVITLSIIELFGFSIWNRLQELTDCQDVVDIMRTIAAMDPPGIIINKVVRPPSGGEYREQFFNCTVASLLDNETITIETLTFPKTMEIWYTHSFKNWIGGGRRRKFPVDDAPAI